MGFCRTGSWLRFQRERIIDISTPAPHPKGEDTESDRKFRRSGERARPFSVASFLQW